MFWDESNRLRVVLEHDAMQHYIYDASGERILKANSDVDAVYENGTVVDLSNITLNTYTTYASAFLVIDPLGVYSKHYYAGSQRIVSRIGEMSSSMFNECEGCGRPALDSDDKTDSKALQQAQISDLQRMLEKAKRGKASFKKYKPYTYEDVELALKEDNKDDEDVSNREVVLDNRPVYFYHPDHLGSSTFLTDFNGNPYQFFINLPFGETMAEQLPSTYYKTPYKFTGKELDEETGLYYYGARYYDPRISVWFSVDPLAQKYPNVNPYVYTFSNPVRYIDPDGKEPTPYEAALMARHVYKGEGDLAGGWALSSVNKFMKYEPNGLGAAMYQRTANGITEYAYVYAGSDDWNDAGNDLSQVVGMSSQYQQVSDLSKVVSRELVNKELTFVGHSLGGGLANLSSLKTGRSSITFNPAWLSRLSVGETVPLKKGNHMDNYVNSADPLDMVQRLCGAAVGLKEYGNTHTVSAGWNPLNHNIFVGHFIGSMIDAIKGYKKISQSPRHF